MGKRMQAKAEHEVTAADREADVERQAGQAAWAINNLIDALKVAGKPVPTWLDKAYMDLGSIKHEAGREWARLTEAEKAGA